jgi:N6-adenosine-specific RNA methylase IME4/ParB-like chromosome segregation protein Spo0J
MMSEVSQMPGGFVIDVPIKDIKIGDRHRKDMGKIELLAESIAQIGLLHPIGLDSDQNLIFGERRLRAFEKLGYETIPARMIHVPSLLLAEHAENEVREEFKHSERVAIAKAIEDELKATERRGRPKAVVEQADLIGAENPQNFGELSGKESAEIAAERAGFGNCETYRQAKAVVEQAEPELVEAMDKGEVAISTAAKLAAAPAEIQRTAAADPKKAIELAKQASAAKIKEIKAGSKEIRSAQSVQRHTQRIEKIQAISQGNAELKTDRTYPVIYADPPWRYDYAASDSRQIENQYPTMSIEDLCALPVSDLAAPDAVLFLWATCPKLPEAMRLITAWGFEYKTSAIWDKQKIGMGYYFRQQHELLLVATRGKIPAPLPDARPKWSIYSEPRDKHSAKPAHFAEVIETMYPDLDRIELFCRAPREGWAVWGNQSHV